MSSMSLITGMEEYSNSKQAQLVDVVENNPRPEDDELFSTINNKEEGLECCCFVCHAKLACPNCENQMIIPKAPGFRFNPTDDELVVEYLKKKVRNIPLPHDKIGEVQLYKNNPEDLTKNHPVLGEKQWYFFTPRDRKYKNGSRPNRAAGSGYWKATGADKPIYHKGELVGHRKALVFYYGKAPKGDKTSWIMHEFTAQQPPRNRTSDTDMRLDDWVLCRIYKKEDIKGPKHSREKEEGGTTDQSDAYANHHLINKSNPNDGIPNTNWSDYPTHDHDYVSGGTTDQGLIVTADHQTPGVLPHENPTYYDPNMLLQSNTIGYAIQSPTTTTFTKNPYNYPYPPPLTQPVNQQFEQILPDDDAAYHFSNSDAFHHHNFSMVNHVLLSSDEAQNNNYGLQNHASSCQSICSFNQVFDDDGN